MTTSQRPGALTRRRVVVRGVVQGVGFRPFVFGLARELELAGHVTNTREGVLTEVEGAPHVLDSFLARLSADAPPLAVVESVAHQDIETVGGEDFTIVPSKDGGRNRTLVPPDTATCADCLRELADPTDRRHRHPFITCTHCGPRFTIVTGLPYDRPNTTMARFPMCRACAREYEDPADRRFHAQPVSCHDCGPQLRLLGVDGGEIAQEALGGAALTRARRLLAEGSILAVKGVGGYHLACDATNAETVATLRRRKERGDKPFALMAADFATIEPLVRCDDTERELLGSAARPIVLLRRRDEPAAMTPKLAEAVAPGSPDLGVMLPYTPLHRLLLGLPGDPPGPELLVLTSGNLSGEPIVIDDEEALVRLAPLADGWLTHDRPIHVPCDDSVVRICDGEPLPVRRSRGYAPLPITLPITVPPTVAVGGDLKNTCAVAEDRHAWLSAHVGDMDDLATLRAFTGVETQLEAITGVAPELLAADLHPGYRSTRWARNAAAGRELRQVQHHHAHIAATMAEHGLDGSARVIGVAFDGTGFGDDGAVWGGEVLLADYTDHHRFAQLSYAPLPGGDAAVRRPYRTALARLHAADLPWTGAMPCVAACAPEEIRLLRQQLERDLNCVPTSSMGRLFDAVASLAGVRQRVEYEAQAAIELEAAARSYVGDGCLGTGRRDVRADGYAFGISADRPRGETAELVADPAPMLAALVSDVTAGVARELIAARFHQSVITTVRQLCASARERHGLETVALSGGVFANTVLSTGCARALTTDGFTVLRHHRVPPNDGGLALGQLLVAARSVQGPTHPTQERGGRHVPGGTGQGA